jgi:hypothetical protein
MSASGRDWSGRLSFCLDPTCFWIERPAGTAGTTIDCRKSESKLVSLYEQSVPSQAKIGVIAMARRDEGGFVDSKLNRLTGASRLGRKAVLRIDLKLCVAHELRSGSSLTRLAARTRRLKSCARHRPADLIEMEPVCGLPPPPRSWPVSLRSPSLPPPIRAVQELGFPQD